APITATTRTCGSARAGTTVTTGSFAAPPTGTTGAGGSGGAWLRAVAGNVPVSVVPGPSCVVVVVWHPPATAATPARSHLVRVRAAPMPVSGRREASVAHSRTRPGIPSRPTAARGTRPARWGILTYVTTCVTQRVTVRDVSGGLSARVPT